MLKSFSEAIQFGNQFAPKALHKGGPNGVTPKIWWGDSVGAAERDPSSTNFTHTHN